MLTWLILATIGSVILLGISGLALLFVLSQKNCYATKVETGGFKFLVKGESLYKVLDNLPKREGFVDQASHKVIASGGGRRGRGWMERLFGISWISIWWPIKQVHRFEVVADKMKSDEEIQSGQIPVRQQIKTDTRETDYLRFRFPHPVLVSDVELGGDNWKVDIIIMLDIEVVNPATVVFTYKGRVLRQVDAAVSSATMNFWREKKYTYNEFVKEDKGQTSPFAEYVLKLNKTTTPGPEKDGLEDRFGVKIMAVWVYVADLTPEQGEFDDAARAVGKEKDLADANEQKARGLSALERGKREGVGLGLQKITENLNKAGLTPDQITVILKEQVRMGSIVDSKLTTYVEGGGNVQPTIPVK